MSGFCVVDTSVLTICLVVVMSVVLDVDAVD